MTTSPDNSPEGDFAGLALRGELTATLRELGYEAPTPIQAEAIPHMLAGRDLLGQAATGTGKTAAFALPLLNRLPEGQRGRTPTALVLVPTRELCMQVSSALHRYGRAFDVRTLPIYGGQPIGRQISELKRGVDVVVATPGRALDHLRRGTLNLDDVDTVVLDEADEMLDMGFAEDLEEILGEAPAQRQTVLFSATMPKRIQAIAGAHLNDPVRIEIAREVTTEGEEPRIRQAAYIVSRAHKVAALGRILDIESPTAALVFCRTRDEVDQLTETLNGRGYRAEGLHGGMDQPQRDRVMGRLRSGNAELLVATDVAARGLDVEHLSHVVNFDVPSAPESYVHRIGRVGRGGREGVAITIAEPREQRLLKTIERALKQKIQVAKIPTSTELRAKRLELTRAALYEVCLDDDLDAYRVVFDSLTDDFDVVQVGLAAIKLAHKSSMPEAAGEDIPQPELSSRRDRPQGRTTKDRGDRKPRRERGAPGGADGRAAGRPGPRRGSKGVERVFVSAGRDAGVRPQDLVGAIANETGLSGRDIGSIQVSDRFAIVEVPAGAAREVITALNRTRLKGNRVKARRDKF